MNPLNLSARNYRSFRKLELDIPAGCVAVTGENGAGKSSIVNLVDLCLFGARSLSEFLSDEADGEEMMIALEFEHRGDIYRVRRTYSGKGRGKSSLDFEQHWSHETENGHGLTMSVAHSEGWNPLTRENASATQELIEATIGLTRETFRASAFLAQGDGAAFTEAAPRDRKRILCDVLGLDIWDTLLERARTDAGAVQGTVERLVARIEEAERELQRKPDVEKQLEAYGVEVGRSELHLREAENAHENAARRLQESREITTRLAAAKEVLAAREREVDQLTARRATITHALAGADEIPKLRAQSQALVDRKPDIERLLAEAQAADKAREEHRRLVFERNRILGEASALNEKAHSLRAQAALVDTASTTTCDRCGQQLGAEAAERAIASYQEEADLLDAEAKGKDQAAAEYENPIARASEQMTGGPNAAEQAKLTADLKVIGEAEKVLAGLDQREQRATELREELEGMKASFPDLENARVDAARQVRDLTAQVGPVDLEADVARAYSNLAERRADVEANKRKVAVAEADLARLEGIEALAAENRRVLGQHQDELDLLLLAERAYGRDGIPALVLENSAIPTLETEAKKILEQLGGKTAGAAIELRTQRELKTRDGLGETLDIVVLTGEGIERRYEQWSGGEKMRINLAIRLALSHLLAHRRGAEVSIFVLDEPSDLDDAGKSDLVEILGAVNRLGIEKVLLVSHDPDLMTAFDQSIQVVIEEGKSRVVAESVREEVTA